MKHVNGSVKSIVSAKRVTFAGSSTCFCENVKYLKNIVDISVIACDETIYIMDIVSTNIDKYYTNKCVNKF